jgi:hypothetical protein
VPTDFDVDRGGATQIAEINHTNLMQLREEMRVVGAQLAEAEVDAAVLAATPAGWYAYAQQVAAADAAAGVGGVPFLDREFLGRMHGKVEAIEQTAVVDGNRLTALRTNHTEESAVVGAPRTVATDLDLLRQTLDAEVRYSPPTLSTLNNCRLLGC